MLITLGHIWHLSTDPLDRLANDVYDCVTDTAPRGGRPVGDA